MQLHCMRSARPLSIGFGRLFPGPFRENIQAINAPKPQNQTFPTISFSHPTRFFHSSFSWWNENDKNDATTTTTTVNAGTSTTTANTSNGNGTNRKKSSVRPSVHHTAPSFRAIKVHFTGELETIDVKSAELLQSSKIHARDLFYLNLTSRQERRRNKARTGPIRRAPAAILPRPTSIVLSFAQIRAVVGRHYALFLEAHDPFVQDFAEDLAATYRHIHNQPKYDKLTTAASVHGHAVKREQEAGELVFLEEVLRCSVESFNRRLRLYDPIVSSFLDSVDSEVYSDTGVHALVPLKDSLQSFEMQVRRCLECLTELLDDDEEMLALLLTEQAKAAETGEAVDFKRHQHVELLLGVYARQLNNLLMEIQFLLQRIQSKQEFVALALAGFRNRLVRMNVHIGIATLSLCLGTTVAGFYGMNVVNGFEQSTVAFYYIVGCSTFAGATVAAGAVNYLSGRTMQERVNQRLREMDTLTGALSDMCALDYAVKSTFNEGTPMTKEEFRQKLRKARQSGEISDPEVDLLFHVMDVVQDGKIGKEDMILMGIKRPQTLADRLNSSHKAS